MKSALFVIALTSALFALPTAAQQGPAGVPGAPAIGASIAPPPPPPPPKKTSQQKRTPTDCSKAKDVEQCKAKQEARKKAREICKGKAGEEHKQCMRDNLPPKK